MDKQRFLQAMQSANAEQQKPTSIGTLREKTLHAVLKHYFEPNTQQHEIKVGRYVVDIAGENGIIEIQTRQLGSLQKKLGVLLASPTVTNFPSITVVYPIIRTKFLTWVNPDTGESSDKRRSPKKGTFCDALYELYSLRGLLTHPHLRICLVLYDGEELRGLTGWSIDKKRGSTRIDRIPSELVDLCYLDTRTDYRNLLPDGLPASFTSKEFMKLARISSRSTWSGLQLLSELGVITRTGKQGRFILYQQTTGTT